MLKKIIHSIVLISLALQLGTFLCVGSLKAADPPPEGSLNSSDMSFSLSGITSTENKSDWIRKGINYFAERIVSILAATAGSFAVLMMAYGGLLMITSAGVDAQITKGKGYLTSAAIGLVFVLGAYLLVITVQLLINGIYG